MSDAGSILKIYNRKNMFKFQKIKNHRPRRNLWFKQNQSSHRRSFVAVGWLFVPVFAVIALVLPARALTINATFDSSVTSLTNAAQVEASFAAAVQMFQNQFTNPITINLTVSISDSVDLGASQTQLVGSSGFNYASLIAALRASATSADDSNAVANLPASDPTGGAQWWIPRAEAKALKVLGVSATDPANDGAVFFATPGPDTAYAFDSTNRMVPDEFDFIGVAEHEISEAIGRTYRLNLGGGYVPFDLFRFTNNSARSLDPYAMNVYFSINNGATQLKQFYPDITSGDVQDWASSDIPDAFDAYVYPGQQLLLSPADITALDILGYNLAPIPSPHLTATVLTGGSIHFSFTNTPGVSYTVLVSTNLASPPANWTVLGAPVENPPGHFQFTDPSPAASPQSYYRVRSP
jgi:hypothetical protein